MKSYAVWAKIRPGKNAKFQRFTRELSGSRQKEYATWMKKCGVERNRTWTQHTNNGDGSVFVWEGSTPDKFYTELARSNDQFAKWYRSQMKEIYGWDFTSRKAWNWNWQGQEYKYSARNK